MEFLPQQNKGCAGDEVPDQILATGKHVVIIGGGDTGADCLGTSHRHKAASVHQFEIMPMPPADRAPQTPWPLWPLQLRVESSHEEGGEPRVEHRPPLRSSAMSTAVSEAASHSSGTGAQIRADPRHRVHYRRRSGAAGHGIHRSREERPAGAARRFSRCARQRRHRCELRHQCARASSRRAICGAANPWSSGRLPKAARPPKACTSYLMQRAWPQAKRNLVAAQS